MLSRCLITKSLHRSSVRSLLRVRCWLGIAFSFLTFSWNTSFFSVSPLIPLHSAVHISSCCWCFPPPKLDLCSSEQEPPALQRPDQGGEVDGVPAPDGGDGRAVHERAVERTEVGTCFRDRERGEERERREREREREERQRDKERERKFSQETDGDIWTITRISGGLVGGRKFQT